jgi:uncharacterized delta-60 repeat protein
MRIGVRHGVAGACALVAGVSAAVALASSGGLDPSFGTSGTTVLDRTVNTLPTPAALMPAGSILVLTSDNDRFTVSRLLADGTPDPTFGADGQTAVQNAPIARAFALALQPDGKIVVAGLVSSGTGSDLAVWRLVPDGGNGTLNSALDPTFDTDGMATFDSSDADRATAVAVQPDGKIVAAGQTFNPSHIGVWRFTASGAHDNTFDTDGAAGIGTDHDLANAMTLQPDGKILLAGQTGTPSTDAAVWRLKPNGGGGALDDALDTTFSTDGRVPIDSGGDSERATAIALAPDNRVLVAGDTNNAPHSSAATVFRLTPGGSLDPTFDTDGAAAVDLDGFASAAAVGVQPDGKILLAGSVKVGSDPFVAALWRLKAGGGPGPINEAVDPTFGITGVTTVASGTGVGAGSLVLQPDRRIVVAGSVFDGRLLMFRALGDPFGLTVTRAGTGAGSVQSSPAGIACDPTCSGAFDDGTSVTLSATAATGSTFAGWSGAGCSGTGTCAVTMGADQTVTATFNANPLPGKHFVLKARQLSMKAFRRNARKAKASITGLPAGTAVSASLVGGRNALARKRAKAGAGGRARLTFKFSKKARKRLRSKKLKSVTLKVAATPPGDTASRASRKVKLKPAR